MQITGKIRERPDIEVKPWEITLKKLSKLFFLSKEDIELMIVRNLSFNGKAKSLWVDSQKIISQLRDVDINHTKRKLTHIQSKLVIPKAMFDEDFTDEEQLQKQFLLFDEMSPASKVPTGEDNRVFSW